jgi:hypothetical protein
MSQHFRPYSLTIFTTLIIALLLGPPLSIAKNLPTVCNIFHKKAMDQTTPCGKRAMFSKIQDKSLEVQAALFSNEDLEISHLTITENNFPSFLLPVGSIAKIIPLRC